MDEETLRIAIEIEQRRLKSQSVHIDHIDPSYLPIHIPGGIGDAIMATDVIQALSDRFRVMVYTEHDEAIYPFYKGFTFKRLPHYSWWLEIDTISQFKTTSSFRGFLVKEHQELFDKQTQVFKSFPQIERLAKRESENFYLIASYAKELGLDRRQMSMWSLGLNPRFDLLPRLSPKKQITVHDGYAINNGQHVKNRSTKQWPIDYWQMLVSFLKRLYPDYEIIQLGNKTAHEIKGVHQCLINKTTLPQAFAILAHSACHIDTDSGFVHAAAKMQVPCVVMWGPTPNEFYGYRENVNLINSPCKYPCYGFLETWMGECAAGYPFPKCMDQVIPQRVLEGVFKVLGKPI